LSAATEAESSVIGKIVIGNTAIRGIRIIRVHIDRYRRRYGYGPPNAQFTERNRVW
jgi:hypothetical protein